MCKFLCTCCCYIFNQAEICSLSENVAALTSKKPTLLSIADSKELRGLLTILYTIVETLRREDEKDTPDERHTRQEFLNDLGLNAKLRYVLGFRLM